MDVIIYHNPDCGTSRNTLGLIRNAGIEPHLIEYLKTPPSRLLLKQLLNRMGAEVVLEVLALPQLGPFTKEDGEPVIDEQGRRVSAA